MLDDRRDAYYDAHFATCRTLFPPYDELSVRLAVDLLLTCDTLNRLAARHLAGFGLSKSTFNVLMLLRSGPPAGIELHELGELLLMSRANITGLIDHLEAKGYVTREVPESDRRVRRARLTPDAEVLLDRVGPEQHRQSSLLLAGITDSEKSQTRDMLRKMRESFRTSAALSAAEPQAAGSDPRGAAGGAETRVDSDRIPTTQTKTSEHR